MQVTEEIPEFADLYLQSSKREEHARNEKFRQAVRIGLIEMERITEEIVMPEFQLVGAILQEAGYDVDVVVFDTEEAEGSFICGAGLKISRGHMRSAIVYTGDPYRFEFVLQTHNYIGRVTEVNVEYHKLTPCWFYENVMDFLHATFRELDFSEYALVEDEQWSLLEGPFTLRVQGEDGKLRRIAEADTIEEAMKTASKICASVQSDDALILEDSNGRRVC